MLDFVIENFKVSQCNSRRTCVERREGPQFGNSKNYPILKIRRAYVQWLRKVCTIVFIVAYIIRFRYIKFHVIWHYVHMFIKH